MRLQGEGAVIAAVAVGGALGSAARYATTLAWPAPPGSFPTATLVVNAVGCAAIGVLMVVISEVRTPHRLVRPFFGTGVLGGFTTFSAYTVDIQQLLHGGRTGLALVSLLGTVATALAAVVTATAVTRRLLVRGTELTGGLQQAEERS
ncbi:fluoride efflux transporter FluC [Streptomyces sp. NPDC057638]|uniref:fluoride efflux transporter FluC n=1 Tax=Streptomyces sp. NPDC057638 TaxID=3346190 RepID=UPI00369883E6